MVSSSTSSRQQRHRRAASSSSTSRRQQSYSSRFRGHSINDVSITALPLPTGLRRRRAPPSDLRFQQRQRQRQQQRHLSVPNNHHRRVFLSPASTSQHSRRSCTLLITSPYTSSSVEPTSDCLRSHQSSSRQSTPSNPSLHRNRNHSPPSCRSAYLQLSLQPALYSSRQSTPSTLSLSRDRQHRTPPSSSPTSSRSAYHQLSFQPALSSRQSTPRSQRQVRFSTPTSAVPSCRSPSPPAYPSAPWHSSVRGPSPAPLGKARTRSSSIRTSPSARPSHYGPMPTLPSLSVHARTRTIPRSPSPRPSHHDPSPLSHTISTERSADNSLVACRRQRSRSPTRHRSHEPPPPFRVSRHVRSISSTATRIRDRPQHTSHSPLSPLRTDLPALIMLQERLLRRQRQRQR